MERGLGNAPAAQQPLAQRLAVFQDELIDLAEAEAGVKAIFVAMMDAIQNARTVVRAPDSTRDRGYGYEWTKDHATRVFAAKVLAQLLRLVPTGDSITVNPGAGLVPPMTQDQKIRELIAAGVDLRRVADDLIREIGPVAVETESQPVQ